MHYFFENGMRVDDLLKLCQDAINNGYGDAIVLVQADADGISDIVVNGSQGYGDEFGEPGHGIFSIVSVKDKAQYEKIYGKPEED